MSESIGIMDPAYFVNKNDILKWINTTLKLNIEKIDHLGTGAVYCQFLDMIYPETVCMSKVNWKAKLEYEYLSNYKIVTTCLEKNDIKKHVEVNKLVKCKYQDNLEFGQWFKKFFDTKCGDRNSGYDAEARRAVKISSVVEIPKVARKEEQTKQKTISASIGAQNLTSSVKDKKPTPNQPVVTNNKRNISELNNGNTAVIKTSPNGLNKTSSIGKNQANTTTPSIRATNGHNKSIINGLTKKEATNTTSCTTTNNTSSTKEIENKEYTTLMNSIKDILNNNQSDIDIVNKIKKLVKVDTIQIMGKENGQNNSQIKQTNQTAAINDTVNTSKSVIEQEVQ